MVEDVVVGGNGLPGVLDVSVVEDEVVEELDELVVYHGGRVQDELLVVEDVVVGGKGLPGVLDVPVEDE